MIGLELGLKARELRPVILDMYLWVWLELKLVDLSEPGGWILDCLGEGAGLGDFRDLLVIVRDSEERGMLWSDWRDWGMGRALEADEGVGLEAWGWLLCFCFSFESIVLFEMLFLSQF